MRIQQVALQMTRKKFNTLVLLNTTRFDNSKLSKLRHNLLLKL
jgi:hypothetical protein